MKSCLYECKVMHHRYQPQKHGFQYKLFMFYLNLDEIDSLTQRLWLLSRNRFNVFNFRDKDHLQLPRENPNTKKQVKQQIIDYLKQQGIELEGGTIMLLTNLSTWGYQFNPVSFYYCFDKHHHPVCVVVEVTNTYHEMKPYFLGNSSLKNEQFSLRTTKYFYVSPFIDMDTEFDFALKIPNESLNIKIDDYQNGKRFFVSALWGKKQKLDNWSTVWFALRFPFITLKVITLIYWNALILWLKKIPYHPKKSFPELQKDLYKPHSH